MAVVSTAELLLSENVGESSSNVVATTSIDTNNNTVIVAIVY